MNAWDELRSALAQAKEADTAIRYHADRMAELLRPHLRSANAHYLRELKRALRDFDMTTGKWKA